jgi:predicted lipid-binding transport protein (Tim44 family)
MRRRAAASLRREEPEMQLDIPTIVFAIVAIFVVWKLRSVLGTRGDPQQRPPFDQHPPGRLTGGLGRAPAGGAVLPFAPVAPPAARAEAPPPPPDRWKGFAEPGSPVAAGFDAIAAADRAFAPDGFVSGAKAAYEMIVGAFAAADMAALKRLLAPEVFANFDAAIRARLAAEQTMTTTLVSIDGADIVEARLTGTLASIAVRFAAKLVSATRDKSGAVVEGSPNDVVDHRDVWTFTRDIASPDPNWLLAATQTVH